MLQRTTINMGSTSHADGLEKGDKEILCGIGNFKPKWLQVFNNATAMCVFITIYAFTHGKVFQSVGVPHYDNMPMQYNAILYGFKNDNFQMKNCDIFLIFAQNIDRGSR